MNKKRSHPKVSLEVRQAVTFVVAFVGILGTLVSVIWLLMPKTGALSYNTKALPLFWLIGIPAFFLALIVIRENLYQNSLFMHGAKPWIEKIMNVVFFISVIGLVVFPFVSGLVRVRWSAKWLVLVGFILAFAGALIYSALKLEDNVPPLKNYRNESEFEANERQLRDIL